MVELALCGQLPLLTTQVHSAVASRQPEDRLGRMGMKSFLQQQPVRPFPLASGRGISAKGSVRACKNSLRLA